MPELGWPALGPYGYQLVLIQHLALVHRQIVMELVLDPVRALVHLDDRALIHLLDVYRLHLRVLLCRNCLYVMQAPL